MALACYLMSSPHSNMIGIYDLPIEYIRYDTALSEEAIREALILFQEEQFAFYDEAHTTIYIPSFSSIQIAPALSPKDNRIPAIQREVDKTFHVEFKKKFLARYGEIYHLSPFEAPSDGSGAPLQRGFEAPPKPLRRGSEGLKSVDNQGAPKGLRRGYDPDPVPDPDEDKRGLGREDDGQRRPPVSKGRGEPAPIGELMRMYQQEIQRK